MEEAAEKAQSAGKSVEWWLCAWASTNFFDLPQPLKCLFSLRVGKKMKNDAQKP